MSKLTRQKFACAVPFNNFIYWLFWRGLSSKFYGEIKELFKFTFVLILQKVEDNHKTNTVKTQLVER